MNSKAGLPASTGAVSNAGPVQSGPINDRKQPNRWGWQTIAKGQCEQTPIEVLRSVCKSDAVVKELKSLRASPHVERTRAWLRGEQWTEFSIRFDDRRNRRTFDFRIVRIREELTSYPCKLERFNSEFEWQRIVDPDRNYNAQLSEINPDWRFCSNAVDLTNRLKVIVDQEILRSELKVSQAQPADHS